MSPADDGILGIPLIALGALVAVTSFTQWRANERAMRRRQPLPKSPMSLVLAIGIAVIAVIAIVLVIRGPSSGPHGHDLVPDQGAPDGSSGSGDPVGVAEAWDEGLSPQRTELAWAAPAWPCSPRWRCWPGGRGTWEATTRRRPWS